MSRYNGWNNNSHKLDGIGGNKPFLNSKNKTVMSNTVDKHTPVIVLSAFNKEDGETYSDAVAKLLLYKESIGEPIPDKWEISITEAPTLKKENEELLKRALYAEKCGYKASENNAKLIAKIIALEERNRVLVEALKQLTNRIENNWGAITSGNQNGVLTALLKEAKEVIQSNQ